jgi:predicted kinase
LFAGSIAGVLARVMLTFRLHRNRWGLVLAGGDRARLQSLRKRIAKNRRLRLAEADARMAEGCGVIVDATFRAAADRRRLLDRVARHGTPAPFFECMAPADEVLRRLREREQNSGEVSDAAREIYLRQAGEFEPITETLRALAPRGRYHRRSGRAREPNRRSRPPIVQFGVNLGPGHQRIYADGMKRRASRK